MYDVHLTKAFFPPQTDAELRDNTVGELLREVAGRCPEATALVDIALDGTVGREWNYRQLLETSERLAGVLVSRFAPGERVVVWAPNIPEWLFLEYACAFSGLVLVTANPSFQEKELRYVLEQSGAVALFLVDSFRGNAMADIAQKAIEGNGQIREVVNLEDETVLFKQGSKLADLLV